MAAATDVEDLMTCGVCLCEYDEVDRKPKFLPCAHTFCLLCLKKICQKDMITCPFCRDTSVLKSNVESLPNNPYALHMLKLKENKNEELSKPIEVENEKDKLKRKIEKSVELYDKQCEDDFRKKVKIAIHLFDENDRRIPTGPLLENGFRLQSLCPSLTGSKIQQDSLLVSHAVFSLLLDQKIQLLREKLTASAQQPCQSSFLSLPSTVRPINKFVLDNSSIFMFRIFHSGYLEGEIVIRPVLTNSKVCDFVQKLGEFCFKTPQVFCSTTSSTHQLIGKAVVGVYVKFPMRNAQFQPSLDPQEKNFVDATQQKSNNGRVVFANQMAEVGLLFENEQVSSDSVTGWSFIFPLENFQNQKYAAHVKEVSECVLFGRVISRLKMRTVTKLSSTKESQRSGYTITLESQ